MNKKHGLDTIELKWGQGAKSIGGEIKVNTIERALELQRRGYIVTPDPSDTRIQSAFKDGTLRESASPLDSPFLCQAASLSHRLSQITTSYLFEVNCNPSMGMSSLDTEEAFAVMLACLA